MSSEIVVPELGESVVEATVGRWLKQVGDPVRVGEPVVELETDKVDLEIGAERDGVLDAIQVEAGEDVAIGDVLGTIDETADVPKAVSAEEQDAAPAGEADAGRDETSEASDEVDAESAAAAEGPGTGSDKTAVEATPVARRLAQEQGIDLATIDGSGSDGRIRKADVEARLEREQASEDQPERPAPAAERGEERTRLSRRRRTIGSRLRQAQQEAVMLTTFNDVDMTAVMELRKQHGERFREQYEVKLGITSFFVRAAVHALRAYPRLNAEIEGDDMVLKHYYDIGVAVGAEEGLVVPVLRNADKMTFAQIEREIRRFVEAAEGGDLTLDDLRGGTFSITNGGVFGSLLSTPILNPPQVGILGLHRIEERPVAIDGEVLVRAMMYVALTYDHRIVDGREAVQFLAQIKHHVEDPAGMLLFAD